MGQWHLALLKKGQVDVKVRRNTGSQGNLLSQLSRNSFPVSHKVMLFIKRKIGMVECRSVPP